jgi:ribosomal protein L37AE/L43A
MFSKNIDKRRKENLVLLKLVNNTKTWYYRINARRQQAKQYKIFKCPQCGQKLRVPRGKGKVSIKCSKCGNKLMKTT